MPYRVELARLRQCEADAVECAYTAKNLEEQDAYFAKAAEYVTHIKALEQQSLS